MYYIFQLITLCKHKPPDLMVTNFATHKTLSVDNHDIWHFVLSAVSESFQGMLRCPFVCIVGIEQPTAVWHVFWDIFER